MRIAQIAPLYESVPPRLYGGTERVVAHLTDELVRQGHEVTLFASGDSETTAELVPFRDVALRLDPARSADIPAHLVMLDEVRRRAEDFDILHFHTDCLHMPLFRDIAGKTVTTLHGRLDLKDLAPFFRRFRDYPLVSISDAQRTALPHARWAGTVYHGYPLDQYPFTAQADGGYLAFLGRMSPEKRPDRAIEIARRLGMPIRLAAKVDAADRAWFRQTIEPLLTDPLVDYVGEIAEVDKGRFLGGASALLFPIDWPEPFGLVMIEALACGTPVVAFGHGSVPEVIEDGITGFIVDTMDAAVDAAARVHTLDRAQIRHRFEERFSVASMANGYLDVYERILHTFTGRKTRLIGLPPTGPRIGISAVEGVTSPANQDGLMVAR